MKNRIKLSIAIISLIVIIFFSILIGITPTNIYAAGDKGLKEEACDAVGCPNGPRTEAKQFLDKDGMLHVLCSCPPTTPPIPDIEIVVPIPN